LWYNLTSLTQYTRLLTDETVPGGQPTRFLGRAMEAEDKTAFKEVPLWLLFQ